MSVFYDPYNNQTVLILLLVYYATTQSQELGGYHLEDKQHQHLVFYVTNKDEFGLFEN